MSETQSEDMETFQQLLRLVSQTKQLEEKTRDLREEVTLTDKKLREKLKKTLTTGTVLELSVSSFIKACRELGESKIELRKLAFELKERKAYSSVLMSKLLGGDLPED